MQSKIFILYTGGTIGMVPNVANNPYSPLAPAPLKELIQYLPGFTDICNPDNYQGDSAKNLATDNSKKDISGEELTPFIELTSGNIISFVSSSFEKPIDSSDVGPEDWHAMANTIAKVYDDYDGFIILHGTDTMAYTASALSFMFENLAKPVVITGSQLPIANMRTDATLNFINSIHIAGYRATNLPLIPEVIIVFADKIIRGCRSSKVSTSDWAGFHSPNFPLLGTIGEHIKINTNHLRKQPSGNKNFFVKTDLVDSVSFITLFPGFRLQQIKQSLQDKDVQGYVLRTYGTGNVPSDPEILKVISEAIDDQDKMIVNISQCQEGSVKMGLYEASNGLLEKGVISGLDLTPEAAVVKMMWTLGTQLGTSRITQMQISQRGEQTENLFDLHFGSQDRAVTSYTNSVSPDGRLDRDRISSAMLRILGMEVTNAELDKEYTFHVFMNMPSANNETSVEEDRCVAVLHFQSNSKDGKDQAQDKQQTMMHNITYKCQNVVGNGDVILSVISKDPMVKFTFRGLFIALYAKA